MSTVILHNAYTTRTQSTPPTSASSATPNAVTSTAKSAPVSAPTTPGASYPLAKVNVPLLKLFSAEYQLPKSLSTSSSPNTPTVVASIPDTVDNRVNAPKSTYAPYTPTRETHAGIVSTPTSINSAISEHSYTTPPSPLIRKKSGELVKSSLKLSALGKSMSTTNIPIRDKSVRFALRLTNIKMFDGRDSPVTVSNECTPLGSPKQCDDELYQPKRRTNLTFTWGSEFEDDFDDDNLGFSGSSSRRTSYFDDDEKDSSSDDDNSNTPPKYFIEYTDVLKNPQRIMSSPVYLQLIKLNEAANTLVGEILAKNIAFEKSLLLKLTFNNWTSNLTINLVSYVKSFGNSDLFKFEIPLMGLSRYLKLELVVRYDVAGQTYWDNNDNKNYHITLKPQPKANNQGVDSKATAQSGPLRMKSVSQLLDSGELFERLDRLQFSSSNKVSGGVPRKQKSKYSFEDSFSNPEPAPLSRSYLDMSFGTTGSRYSQAYKNKKGYNDLLNSYCFFKSDKTTGSLPGSPSGDASLSEPHTSHDIPCTQQSGAVANASSKPSSSLNSTGSADYLGLSLNCHSSVGSTFHSFSDSVHV